MLTTELLLFIIGAMEKRTLTRATGNWVVGEQFWDREAELKLLIERLDEGAHLLLVAPRRMGKTSLMREAARRIENRYLCLHVDLQKAQSAADAIVELSVAAHRYKPLWERTKGVFQNVLRDTIESIEIDEIAVTLRSGLTAGDWQEKGDRLFEILATHKKPVVIFFDEVPILVNRLLKGTDYAITPERREAADAFLSWLRANSVHHQRSIRMVITGSIGLEPVVHQAGLSATLNTLTPFPLASWSRETATGCLNALAAGYGLTLQPDAVREMLDRLGLFIPHHVQMFFDNVLQAARLRGITDISRQLAAEVYEHSMLGLRGHAELSHLEERLRMVLGPELDLLALDLLTEAAVAGSLTDEAAAVLARRHFSDEAPFAIGFAPATQATEPPGRRFCDEWKAPLRHVLAILEHDGYLEKRDGAYVFSSRLVRDWWKARFNFAYAPVSRQGV